MGPRVPEQRRRCNGHTGTLRQEALERYFGGTSHVEPAWYYARIVALGFLPWVGPLLVAAVRLVRQRREETSKTALYAGAGLAAGLLFFTLGKGKLPNYLLPLAPLAAILVTWELGQELWEPRRKKLGSILLTVTLFATCAALASNWSRGLRPELAHVMLATSIISGIGAGVALAGVLAHRPRITYGAGALAMAVSLGTALAVMPTSLLASNSAAALVEQTPQLRSGRPIVIVDRELPSLTYYLDRIPEKAFTRDLPELLSRADDPLLVMSDRNWDALPPETHASVHVVNRVGKFYVFERARESGANEPP